jgi:hypothetical protein
MMACQEPHDAGITEAQRRHPLPSDHGRLLETLEGVLGEYAMVADVLHLEQLATDLLA